MQSITNPDFPYWLNPEINPNGLAVSPWSILGLAPVNQGLNLICSHVAKCDLLVKKRIGKSGGIADKNHPCYKLLRRRPQAEMKIYDWKRSLVLNAIVQGNAYAYIKRKNNIPVELVLLDSFATTVQHDDQGWFYRSTMIDGSTLLKRSADIIHVKGLSYHGVAGYPLVNILKETLQLSQYILKYKNTFFANGGKPPYAVLMGTGFTNKDRREEFRTSLAKKHGDVRNSNKPLVLEGDTSIHEFSQPDFQALINMTDQETKAIANILGIPASFLGVSDEYTSHNSLEQQSKQLLNYTIDGWLTNIEEELEEKLLTEVELDNETHCIDFDRSALEDLDETTRVTTINTKVSNGLMSWEEARDYFGLDQNKNQTFFRPLQAARVDSEFMPIPVEPPEAPETDQQEQQEPPEQQEPDESASEQQSDIDPETNAEQQSDIAEQLKTKSVVRCLERIKKSIEQHAKKGDLTKYSRVDLQEEHRSVLQDNFDCYSTCDIVLDDVFELLQNELEYILPEQVASIEWDKYQKTLIEGLK